PPSTVSHPVSQTTTTTTYTTPVSHPIAPVDNVNRIPIAHPPTEIKYTTVPTVPSHVEVKHTPVAQPHIEHHNPATHTTINNNVPAPSAYPSNVHAAAVPVASAVHPMHNALHRDGSSDIPKDNSAHVAATDASVLLAQQEYAQKHAHAVPSTHTHQPTAPISTHSNIAPKAAAAAAVPVAAAGTAAYIGTRKDPVHESHTTHSPIVHGASPSVPESAVVHHFDSAVAPGVTAAPKHDTVHHQVADAPSRPLSEKITAPIVGAAAGTAAYLGAKTEAVKEAIHDMTHKDATLPSTTTHHTTIPAPVTTKVTTTTVEHSKPAAPTEVHHTTVKPIDHVEYTIRPEQYTTPTVPLHTVSSVPVTERVTVVEHNRSLSEKITAPLAGAAAAVTGAAAGTATYLGAKKDAVKEALTSHDSTPVGHTTTHTTTVPTTQYTTTTTTTTHKPSEYGPADPRDLPLEDVSRVRPLTAPVVAAAASTAAPVIATKETIKETVTVPTPSTYTTSSTTTTTKPNPVLTAPRPVIPTQVVNNNISHTNIPNNNITTNKTTTTTHSNVAPIAPVIATPVADAYRTTTSSNTTTIPTSTTTSTTTYNTQTTPATSVIASSSSSRRSSATPGEIASADRIAAAIPATYHGPIPTVAPGEEVIWVKTITTTDFYDDEADGVVDRNGDVVSTHQTVLPPNAYATAQNGSVTYVNNNASGPNQADKGKQRL
ncbi:hypothetical protein BGZ94_007891, partial [Podila epigama]